MNAMERMQRRIFRDQQKQQRLLKWSLAPSKSPTTGLFHRDWDADPDFNAGEKDMNMSIYHADDFTRSHPVLTGKRKGTMLRERLERIRDTTKKASVRKAAEQWLREMEAKA